MREIVIGSRGREAAVFVEAERDDGGRVRLARLFGLACDGGDGPGFALRADGRRYSSADFSMARFNHDHDHDDHDYDEHDQDEHGRDERDGGRAAVEWRTADGRFALATEWSACPRTGVLSRRDRLTNVGASGAVVTRCLPRFTLADAGGEFYFQSSAWSRENQGAWTRLHAGTLVLTCRPGRTTEGATPCLALRAGGGGRGLAFHVLPKGNWTIRAGEGAVELGLSDEDLAFELAPGESVDLPEVLVQETPEGEPHLAAPELHRWALARMAPSANAEPPVVYNTWFYESEVLDVPRLRRQLAAAAEVGCEVFVVDAGWFGRGEGDWWAQVGDWREKLSGAFEGRMSDFADEVRGAGLGFGLWMEAERVGPRAPLAVERPDLLVPAGGGCRRWALERDEPRERLRAEIARLVETYGLAWIKIDFNFDLGADPSGAELLRYFEGLYALLDALRAAHPGTYFEGCSSGGMRADLNTVSRFNMHFLSDTVNPTDVIRIGEGALLRMPPGRIGRWAVLRSAGRSVPEYLKPVAESAPAVLAPGGGQWPGAAMADPDYAALAAMPGVFGVSGDLAGLPPDARESLARHVAFYREWRRFIADLHAHLLTSPRPKLDRTGWSALELAGRDGDAALVFAYRLAESPARKTFRLRGLAANADHEVRRFGDPTDEARRATGRELADRGIEVALPAEFTAALYVVRRAGGC